MVLHKCLGRNGYVVLTDKLSLEEIQKYRKECTVESKVLPAYRSFQKPKKYTLYYMSRDKTALYLPRFYALDNLGEPDYIALTNGASIPPNVKCKWYPLPHQLAATAKLDEVFNLNHKLGNGGVLSLPCGYGKTYCAIRTVCKLGLAALIIVPTECLMDQWIDAIKQFAPAASVGYLQRDHIDIDNKDFVVAMLHSICLKDYKITLFDRFGITIFDECHHIASETFSKCMMKIRTRFTLGLSATPNRRDGLSEVFYKFIGPLIHKEKRTGSNQIIVKKVLLYSNSSSYQVLKKQIGKDLITNTSGMITAISKMDERNKLIIFTLKELIAQGRKILLISGRKEQLYILKDMLDIEAIKKPDGKLATYGFYHGKSGMSREAHKAILATSAKCDIVLGIDVIAKEGLDIPDRNTLVWATPPGMEIEQPVGRILRRFHKDVNPYVIDFVDNTGNFVEHSRQRDIWFKEEDYIISRCRVELLGDADMWKLPITTYLNKNEKVESKLKSNLKPELEDGDAYQRNKEPDFDDCILADEDGNKPVKVKINLKTKTKTKTKTDPIDNCILRTVQPIKQSRQKKSEPNFDTLLL